MKNSTLDYYNKNADSFFKRTINHIITDTQKSFCEKIPKNGRILDFGCGSGRDSKLFINMGYEVDAIDGSIEICKVASSYIGINVKHMLFQDLKEKEKYDGIWACSSILHLPKKELIDVLKKMSDALKTMGIIYTSFKYGDFEGERNERHFTDFTEKSFNSFIKDIKELKILECWITNDVRPQKSNEKWLNVFLQKN